MSVKAAAGVARRGCGDDGLYGLLAEQACARLHAHTARPHAHNESDPSAAFLQELCDDLWRALSPRGLSWIGFYLIDPDAPLLRPQREGAMLLTASRDSPACSPIGLHGVCGQAFLQENIRLVEDVAALGSDYIACDPRDRSEIVIPVYRNSHCIGVLDADSHEVACFGEVDIRGLTAVLRAARLLDGTPPLHANLLQEIPRTL